jgi:hypothetical protein
VYFSTIQPIFGVVEKKPIKRVEKPDYKHRLFYTEDGGDIFH